MCTIIICIQLLKVKSLKLVKMQKKINLQDIILVINAPISLADRFTSNSLCVECLYIKSYSKEEIYKRNVKRKLKRKLDSEFRKKRKYRLII